MARGESGSVQGEQYEREMFRRGHDGEERCVKDITPFSLSISPAAAAFGA